MPSGLAKVFNCLLVPSTKSCNEKISELPGTKIIQDNKILHTRKYWSLMHTEIIKLNLFILDLILTGSLCVDIFSLTLMCQKQPIHMNIDFLPSCF